MSEAGADDRAGERLNNRIALTIALLATFMAISTIKSGNVEAAVAQAQAERNNSWAWYQAVRVREDMGTYVLADLQRALRNSASEEESARLTAEISAQEDEIVHIRERKDEVEQRARGAEAELESLNVIADQYDFSDALLSIALALFAVCALGKVEWLYWFAMTPALGGVAWAAASMLNYVIPMQGLLVWLN